MRSWVRFASQKRGGDPKRGVDPFQTEAFLGHVLSSAKVHKMDLKRADVRRQGAPVWIAAFYIQLSLKTVLAAF